jgi:hypothetical protein
MLSLVCDSLLLLAKFVYQWEAAFREGAGALYGRTIDRWRESTVSQAMQDYCRRADGRHDAYIVQNCMSAMLGF